MKKQRFLNEIENVGKKTAIMMATHYANVTCPMVIFQPKLPESVKKLRKF